MEHRKQKAPAARLVDRGQKSTRATTKRGRKSYGPYPVECHTVSLRPELFKACALEWENMPEVRSVSRGVSLALDQWIKARRAGKLDRPPDPATDGGAVVGLRIPPTLWGPLAKLARLQRLPAVEVLLEALAGYLAEHPLTSREERDYLSRPRV